MTTPHKVTTLQKTNILSVVSSIAAVICIIIWLIAIQYYEQSARSLLQDKAQRHTNALAIALQLDIEKRLVVFNGFKQYVDIIITDINIPLKEPTTEQIKSFVEPQFNNVSGFKYFTIAPNGIQTWVYPQTGNASVIGHNLINDKRANVRADIKSAIETRQLVLSGPYPLRQGELGLIASQAIFKNDQFWGLVSMVIDMGQVLKSTEFSAKNDKIMVALRIKDGQAFWGNMKKFPRPRTTSTISLPGQTWQLMIQPNIGMDAVIAEDTLLFKFLFALFLIILLILFHTFLHRLSHFPDKHGN